MLSRNYFFTLLLGLLVIAGGCEKDEADPNMPVLKLVPEKVTDKAGKTVATTSYIMA